MKVLRTLTAAVAFLLGLPVLVMAQGSASGLELSVANIMRGPEHVGEPPSMVRWTDDGRWIYFRWKPGGEEWYDSSALLRMPSSGVVLVRPPDSKYYTESAD